MASFVILKLVLLVVLIGYSTCEDNITWTNNNYMRVVPKVDTRIIGGENVLDGSTPWMVSLGYFVSPYFYKVCGGTIIDNQYILTTASCCVAMANIPYSYWRVAVGITNMNYLTLSNLKTVFQCTIHASYNPYSYVNDIAVVTLSSPLVKSTTVDSICLETSTTYYFGNGYTVGWGQIANNLYPTTLQGLQFCVLNPAVCESYFSTSIFQKSTQICGGDSDGSGTVVRKDICTGDGGGPLFTFVSGRVKQLGITSYLSLKKDINGNVVSKCNGLSGFTAVSSYKAWIEARIGKSISTLACKSTIPTNFISNFNPVKC